MLLWLYPWEGISLKISKGNLVPRFLAKRKTLKSKDQVCDYLQAVLPLDFGIILLH